MRICVEIRDRLCPFFRALILVSLPVVWLLPAEPVLAVEEEVYFQSDHQREIQDEQVLLLQGNVEVHFRDVIIFADEVRLNDAKDEFFGAGDVRFQGPDRDIFADSIWFNYSRDEFDMRNARGSLIVKGVSEIVWFEASRLKGNIDDYRMIQGRVTTCSPDERREYHVEARYIRVMPDNKVIFRNGYIFILNVPVLWLPYWAYSLEETPWTVDVGKDSMNGVYVRTKYNYLAEELIVGTLIMEYYSRRGARVGGEHRYLLPRHGVGSFGCLFTYGTYRNTFDGTVTHANEYNLNLQQAIRFGSRFSGNIRFRASSSYNLGRGRSNSANGTLGGSYNTANTRTQFNLNMGQTSGDTQRSDITASLNHNRTIFENVTSTWKFDYKVNKQREGMAADEELTTRLLFRQQRDQWNWTMKIDSHWDPDGFTNVTDRSRGYTDRLPEITLTFQPNAFPSEFRNWMGFQMGPLNMLGALYYIGPETREINGFYGRMDTRFTRNDNLSQSHSLQTTVTPWQAICSTGDAQYHYSTQVNWTWNMTKKLRWTMGWNRTEEEGRIPLQGLGKASSQTNRLNWNLNYQNGRLYTIRLATSYVLNERFRDAPGELLSIKRLGSFSFSFTYTPNRKVTITVNTTYDLAKDDLGNIRIGCNMTDNDSYRVRTDINYDPPGTIMQFRTVSTFIMGSNWDFVVTTEFSPKASDSIVESVQITHRLDCTFLSFQYQSRNEQWFLTWGVTGYPQAKLGYDTSGDPFGPDFLSQLQTTGTFY